MKYRVKEIRKEKGMTQVELAEKSGSGEIRTSAESGSRAV